MMALASDQVFSGDALRSHLARETVAVYGYGRTGQSVVRVLRDLGSDVVVFEDDPDSVDQSSEPADVRWSFEDHDVRDVDRLIVSPGVPFDHSVLEEARRRGIDCWAEVELAYRLIETGTVWAVTGTNGKSTCVEWAGALLEERESTPVSVCGNRGTPLIEAVHDDRDYSDYVVEISSFQVEGMYVFQPDAVLLTSLGDDHRDRHGSLEAYHRLKWELVRRVSAKGRAVVPDTATPVPESASWSSSRTLRVSSSAVEGGAFSIQWTANGLRLDGDTIRAKQFPTGLRLFPENIMSVIGLVLDRPDRGIVEGALERFEPLPHRAEGMEGTGSVRVIEDSKATNPGAVQRLIETVREPYRLVLGGAGKGADFSDLFGILGEQPPEQLILCGEKEFVETLRRQAVEANLQPEVVSGWESAVKDVVNNATENERVLLSPGGTSFDAFNNYKERGRAFQKWVREAVSP